MNILSKEQLTDCMKPVFKQKGFRKVKTTWRKTTDELIYVVNIQGSQWSNEDYYINVAIYIKALGTEINPTEYRCHVRSRIDQEKKSCVSICKEVLDWFEKYGDIHRLKTIRQQNELPLMITVDTHNYLDKI